MSGDPFSVIRDLLHPYGVKEVSPGRLRAACPVCGGKNKSTLSCGEGTDGAVLLRCWKSECSVDSICAALGISVVDLFPVRQSDNATGPVKRRRLLSPMQCLDVIEFECLLVWTAAHNLANGHGLKPEDLTRLSVAAARIGGLIREVRA